MTPLAAFRRYAPQPRSRDWQAMHPPTPLPRPVAPMPHEAIHHYLRRLATANHLSINQIVDLVHMLPGKLPPGLDLRERSRERLATAAGQPISRINRLYWGDPSPAPPFGKPVAYGEGLRPACRRCAARHGLLDAVPCMHPDHDMICRRHELWIGPGIWTPAAQHDLSAFPELLRAQRHHDRLVRRHDPAKVTHAHRDAGRAWRHRLRRQATWTPAQQDRHTAFAPADSHTQLLPPEQRFSRPDYLNSIAATIAIYPDVVALTEQLLDHQPDQMAQIK